ncbi:MAG: DUF2066 domain-containing protein [Coxiellaceae bacterium]|nr:DUF2066 domain-containing protein [Coxiellaceae bacterium]
MIHSLKAIILSLMLALCLGVSTAVQAKSDFMTTLVAVNNYSPKALRQSLTDALAQVLIKVSGNTAVMTLPQVQNELPHINELVSAYSYQSNDNHADNQANNTPPLQLKVAFNQRAIKRLLRAAGQSVWNADRPATLVWLDVHSTQNEEMVSAGGANAQPVAQALVRDATSRGLNLIFPMMDLSDQNYFAVGATDQLLNVGQVQAASKRYSVSSILSGKVTEVGGQWQADWVYILDGAPIRWQDEADSVDQLAVAAVNNLAGTMISQLAMASSDQGQSSVLLRISGIADLSQYAMVQDYLQSLKPISKVTVETVDPSQMVIRLEYQGQLNQLKRVLRNGQRLGADQTEWLQQADNPTLAYHWIGGVS